MKKIPTIFVRDWDGNPKYVTREQNPECAWVFPGEGTATVKWDGTCVMLDDDGAWWARREVKPGKNPPPDFQPIATDEETGKTIGWEPVARSAFARWHTEAVDNTPTTQPGTYELVGPKINGNPEGFHMHVLVRHGWAPLLDRETVQDAPRDFDGLAAWLHQHSYEGIVWHHPDRRRMAKIKARDFPPPTTEEGNR